jgi:hypothetical protein
MSAFLFIDPVDRQERCLSFSGEIWRPVLSLRKIKPVSFWIFGFLVFNFSVHPYYGVCSFYCTFISL